MTTENSSTQGGGPERSALLAALGVELDDALLELALTHRSYAYEHGGLPTNERLEFLGDSVLGLSITEKLYLDHPDKPEGELAKIRASVVNMHALAEVARGLGEGGLGAHLLLGKGEEQTGGRDKASILADGMESLLGAVHLQYGLDRAREVVLTLFSGLLERGPRLGAGLDWKTSLQELTAERGLGVPRYEIAATGPDHDKEFTATVLVGGQPRGVGVGRTKKEAEQKAAGVAWGSLSDDAATSAGVGEAGDTAVTDSAAPGDKGEAGSAAAATAD
ncbi:ribonuclease III [Rhodococcus sp. D2-41]|uniref:ribonuclease III n=1 Tax=Speluncibacter jeojiensis TaxID=2710754 RepID=UPI00240F8482|nr:ribonuclease III [Rhodococcus sp. D2-41]MDG3011053.1 ribonuclease III [Rhodococcus sp. D2-41]